MESSPFLAAIAIAPSARPSTSSDTSGSSVQGQRFASDGTAVGGQFQVNSYTTSGQYGPLVVVTSDGDFVVVWSSDGSNGSDTSGFSVQGQRFASDGTTVGGQFQVNSYTTSNQAISGLAVTSDIAPPHHHEIAVGIRRRHHRQWLGGVQKTPRFREISGVPWLTIRRATAY